MRAAIRADAGHHIGTGHVMRCLTLAEALKQRGTEVKFLCRAHSGHLINHIQDRGFGVVKLGGDAKGCPKPMVRKAVPYAHWLGTDWQTSFIQTRSALAELDGVDLLIVDHYALDAAWEGGMRDQVVHIMAIDDLADRRHDADILLDQTVGRQAADYQPLVPAGCRLLLGADYALLRPEFARLRQRALERRTQRLDRPHILLTFGGFDAENITQRALAGLEMMDASLLGPVTVIIGDKSPNTVSLRTMASSSLLDVRVLTNPPHMAELMMQADLAIGAAGTTSWERCALGLPALLVVAADNQELIARSLERTGASITLGSATEVTAASFAESVGNLLLDHEHISAMSRAAASICDGRGCDRVIEALETLELRQ